MYIERQIDRHTDRGHIEIDKTICICMHTQFIPSNSSSIMIRRFCLKTYRYKYKKVQFYSVKYSTAQMQGITNAVTRKRKRVHKRRLTRLHEAENAFLRDSERDRTQTQTRSHEEANAFTRGGKGVHTRRRRQTRQRTHFRGAENAITRTLLHHTRMSELQCYNGLEK